jgi:pimeloyl-ACP methyl ester carboxylesterase
MWFAKRTAMPNLATALIGFERFISGLRRRAIQVSDHRVVYSEGGSTGEAILLLHGFGASGDSWNRLAAKLIKKHYVIAPDLPGWGASTRLESASYAYASQLDRLHALITELKLERFHLAGHSMGGFLAAAYAARFPDAVISLGLLAPHGLAEPQPSDLARSVQRGDNWLVASSLEGFQRMLDNLFVRRPYIPGVVIKYLAKVAMSRSAKSQEIFEEMQRNDPPLIKRLPEIQAPALIVWGDQDRVLHVSCAEQFKANIKQAQLLIVKNCGHMPLTEQLNAWAALYLAFVEDAGHPSAKRAPA